MCDALSGRCIPPPLGFPGRIRWPAAPCLNAPPRSMCMDEAARHPPGSCSGYMPNQKCRACSACVLAPKEGKKGLGRGARRGGRVL